MPMPRFLSCVAALALSASLAGNLAAEQPKLNPHIPAMQEQLARCMRCDESQISIKATTTERLGYTGRGEGIAAHAVALIVK